MILFCIILGLSVLSIIISVIAIYNSKEAISTSKEFLKEQTTDKTANKKEEDNESI